LFTPAAPPADRRPLVAPSVTNRSRITNGSRLLQGIDGRSSEARRYRDLVQAFGADLGGVETLGEADKALVRQCAASVTASETLQAAIIRGDAVDLEQSTRLSNATGRLLTKLAALTKARAPKPPSLADYLAGKREGGG
jgi:hypothetical protein